MDDTSANKNTALADPPAERATPEEVVTQLGQATGIKRFLGGAGAPLAFVKHKFRLPSKKEFLFTMAGLCLALGAGYVLIGPGGPKEEPVESDEQMPVVEDTDDILRNDLSPDELLKLAEGALAANELSRAATFLEEGLARTDFRRDDLRSRYFMMFRALSRKRGETLKAKVYGENSDRLMIKSATAVALYHDAVEAHAAGRYGEARALICRFLLRQGELTAKRREKLAPLATRLMGFIFHDEWASGVVGPVKVIAEPPFDFGADL